MNIKRNLTPKEETSRRQREYEGVERVRGRLEEVIRKKLKA